MNNINFALVRLLRREGVDAELLLFDEEFEHFHPSSDSYNLEFAKYSRSLSWGSGRRFLGTTRKRVVADTSAYDVLIGCGLAPAYCHRIGRPLDVFVPYGGDIFLETTFRPVRPDTVPSVWAAAWAQRAGIRQARVVHMPYTNQTYERRLTRFRGDQARWHCGVPMVDLVAYDPALLHLKFDRTHWYHEFKNVRDHCDLMLMSSARHVWHDSSPAPHQKGTDVLLRGLALFLKNNPRLKVTLVTLEYGVDVPRSKRLIEELRISANVAWFPKMLRKDLMVGLSMVDVACGEFAVGWLESGVRYEALALGKPLLAFRDDAAYITRYPSLYPIMNARTPEGICDRLSEYMAKPEAHREIGREGRRWYEECVVQESRGKYMGYLSGLASEGWHTRSVTR